MRRFGTIVLLLALAGCAKGPTHLAPETYFRGLDFREYTSQGFLFTPYRYDGAFESIGLVTVTLWAEGELVPVGREKFKEWRFKPLDVQDVLRAAHRHAVERGADALVDLKLTATDRPIEKSSQRQPGIELSGYAIRRLSPPAGR